MIGLDTNILVRYLTQDDPAQSKLATKLMEEELTAENPGYIGLVVLAETVWVLQSAYHATRSEARQTVADLLQCRQLVVEQRAVVMRALTHASESNGGFVDAMVAAGALASGCTSIYTFDRGASQVGMTLLNR